MNRPSLRTYLNVGLAVVVIGVGFGTSKAFASDKASPKTSPRTATVQQGSVLQTVSASGNVASATTDSLNFSSSGTLTEVDVTAGQAVTAGQVLAKIDSSSAKAALDLANAQLASANVKLTAANAESTTTTTTVAVNTALENAKSQQQFDAHQTQAAVDSAQRQLAADQATLTKDQAALVTAQASGDATSIALAQQQVNNDQSMVNRDQQTLASAQSTQASVAQRDAQTVSSAQSSGSYSSSGSNSSVGVVTAAQKAADIATAQAGVESAQVSVNNAQKTFDGTTLTAPVSGTITTVNNKVGDTIGSGSTSSAASNTSSASNGNNNASSSSTSSSSSAFITLTDPNALQVTANFSESDIAKIKVGQPASLTFDALSNTTASGTVASIANTSTVTNNVVTYSAVISIVSPPATLKTGMSATISVVVNSVDNVLHVPSTAIKNGSVTIVENGQPVVTRVTTGLVGDTATEIKSGLTIDQVVELPAVKATTSTSGTNNRTSGSNRTTGGFTGGGNFGGGGGFTGPPPGN